MNFCHDCVYYHYHAFDYDFINLYICDKHEDREDIEYDTAACDDFESDGQQAD